MAGEQFSCRFPEGAICLSNYPRVQLSSGAIVRGAIFLGGNCPRTDLHHPRQKFSTHAIFLTRTTHSKIWQTPRFTTVAIAAPFYQ